MSFQLNFEKRARATMDGTADPHAGLPLVCLHGWGMNLRVFDLLRGDLASQCETWAVDLAGHGRSPWVPGHADFEAQVQDVLAVLPARCVLLGWSFGGKLAIEIAARHPERIAALVLLSVSPKFALGPDWPHGLDARSMQAFRIVLEQDWQQTLGDFVWLQLRGSRNAEEAQQVMEQALTEQGPPHPEALRNGLDLLSAVDLRVRVQAITQPVLLISGQHDRVTPPGAARWMSERLPQSTLIEIPRAGHAAFVSHHQEVATALRKFLASNAAVLA